MTHPEPVVVQDSGVPEVEQAGPPVIIRATVEDMIGCTEDWEIPRSDWDSWTPAKRRAAIDDFGATTMNNAGGYGASLLSGAPDTDLIDPPVTPAEERTGISDVQHAVLGEVAALRRNLARYSQDKEFGSVSSARASYRACIDGIGRIEQWARGDQR